MDNNQNSSCIPTNRLTEKVMLLPRVCATAGFFDMTLTESDLNNVLPSTDLDEFKIQAKFKIRSKSKGNTKQSPKRKRIRITKAISSTTERKKENQDNSECTLRTRSTREETSDKTELSTWQDKAKNSIVIAEERKTKKNESLRALSPNTKAIEIARDRLKIIESGRRTTSLRGNSDIERTFDIKGTTDIASYATESPNRSCDVRFNTPNIMPKEVYDILKDLNGTEQKMLQEKERIPQIFISEERREGFQRKGRQKSETVCWQEYVKQGRGSSQSKFEDNTEPLIVHLGLPIVTRNYMTQISEKQKKKELQEKNTEGLSTKGNAQGIKVKRIMELFSFKESFKMKQAGLVFNRKNSPFLEIKKVDWGSMVKKDNFLQKIFSVKEKPITLGELQVI